MDQKPAATYYLTLSAGPSTPDASVYLALYDEDHELLHQETHALMSFCYTWKDLCEYVERRFTEHGGTLNHNSRPSPFVDLT